jgi:hypothetical protein
MQQQEQQQQERQQQQLVVMTSSQRSTDLRQLTKTAVVMIMNAPAKI